MEGVGSHTVLVLAVPGQQSYTELLRSADSGCDLQVGWMHTL